MPDMNDVQAELMDMITKDESPSKISDKIKDMLFAKSAERIDAYKPDVANSLFGDQEDEVDDEVDSETEIDAEADEEETPVAAAETGAE
jgi:hypothetical protein|tara:strand:+ start:537 stop:803 length:267 start_codon:yes stop_codon:yes gene_type:complete